MAFYLKRRLDFARFMLIFVLTFGAHANIALGKKLSSLSSDQLTQLFEKARRDFHGGALSRKAYWQKLTALHQLMEKKLSIDLTKILQAQSYLLLEDRFYWMSAQYAAMSILTPSKKKDADALQASWHILEKVSSFRKIDELFVEIVRKTNWTLQSPSPHLGSDWFYYVGEFFRQKGNLVQAATAYEKLTLSDTHFLQSQYQLALIRYEQNKPQLALKLFRSLANIYPKGAPDSGKQTILDYTYLAVGRLEYELGNYLPSIRNYRMVGKESPLFYDSLFEQSWAFFLGGYPLHALGALHGADSPFYASRYNPEIPILRSLIYFWLCRYEDAEEALSQLSDGDVESLDGLDAFVKRKNFNPSKAYQLFENLISGVSSASLGIRRDLLKSVAQSDPMMLDRDRLASLSEEKRRLNRRGVFGSKSSSRYLENQLDQILLLHKVQLGSTFLQQLARASENYKNMKSQIEFLRVELLMSRKEQVLGKELHASSKLHHPRKNAPRSGWGSANVSWEDSLKGEYWWDEVGFYIYNLEPQCKEI